MSETSQSAASILAVQGLRFSYGDRSVLDLDEFRLGAQDSMAVIGPSGCGKTTFLHLLAGLISPESGSIRVLDQDITRMRPTELDRFRGQHIGMVFQKLFLMPALSVRQNVELAQEMARKPKDIQRVDVLLEELGLQDLGHHRPSQLSQGQAQRVAIARALVHDPVLVLADEPTSALDDDRADDALALLKSSAEAAGASLLVVTHDQRVRGKLNREFEMEPLS